VNDIDDCNFMVRRWLLYRTQKYNKHCQLSSEECLRASQSFHTMSPTA